jgi:hypothetical protein
MKRQCDRTLAGGGEGDFRQLREQLYSSLSGAGLPLPPNRPPDTQDFRFVDLNIWLATIFIDTPCP